MYRNSFYFCVALIGMLLLGLLLGGETADSPSERQGLLPDLKDEWPQIQTISLSDSEAGVTLRRSGGRWVVQERQSYPADKARVADFIRDLAEAERLERKTRKPELFSRLGVAENAITAQIGDTVTLHIGNSPANRAGRYVRLGADEVWLASADLTGLSARPPAWLDKSIIDVPMSQVKSIAFNVAGETLKASRNEAGDVIVEGVAEDEYRYAGIEEGLLRALTGVRLLDVAPRGELDFTAGSKLQAVLVEGNDIVIRLLEDNGRYYLWMPDHEWADRVFEISRQTYDTLRKTRADIVKQTQAEDSELEANP